MTARAILAIGAGSFVAGLLLGTTLQGWRLGAELAELRADHAVELQQLADTNAGALAAQEHARQHLEQQLAAIDTQRYQELTNAQQNTDRLAADLAVARQRLRVRIDPASCPGLPAATGAASLDDGAGTAELHPATAADLAGLAGDADACAVTLSALQEWARLVTAPR